jgi:hypothetical protein
LNSITPYCPQPQPQPTARTSKHKKCPYSHLTKDDILGTAKGLFDDLTVNAGSRALMSHWSTTYPVSLDHTVDDTTSTTSGSMLNDHRSGQERLNTFAFTTTRSPCTSTYLLTGRNAVRSYFDLICTHWSRKVTVYHSRYSLPHSMGERDALANHGAVAGARDSETEAESDADVGMDCGADEDVQARSSGHDLNPPHPHQQQCRPELVVEFSINWTWNKRIKLSSNSPSSSPSPSSTVPSSPTSTTISTAPSASASASTSFSASTPYMDADDDLPPVPTATSISAAMTSMSPVPTFTITVEGTPRPARGRGGNVGRMWTEYRTMMLWFDEYAKIVDMVCRTTSGRETSVLYARDPDCRNQLEGEEEERLRIRIGRGRGMIGVL